MAQAAWTSPSLRISSWSCMGPRQRQNSSVSNSKAEEKYGNSNQSADVVRLLTSETKSALRSEVITSEGGTGWTSEMECSPSFPSSHQSQEIEINDDEGSSDGEDLMGHGRIEDSMTEVELWQQLEHELNQPSSEEAVDDEDDMVKEAREEEEEEIAAAAEVADNVSVEATAEMRRFFPPGKIMHIVPIPREEIAGDEEEGREEDGGGRTPKVPKVGIFLTQRSLYGKLRLSQTMINDHYMPMYKRNIELVISELEKDGLSMDGVHL